MLIPILRTAQARVFVEQPPERGRVSRVGGTHGRPNRLALLVVEFQWLNQKMTRPMFTSDDISMTGSSTSHGRIRVDESHDARACAGAQRLRAVHWWRPTNGRLTTIGFNHRFRFEDSS